MRKSLRFLQVGYIYTYRNNLKNKKKIKKGL